VLPILALAGPLPEVNYDFPARVKDLAVLGIEPGNPWEKEDLRICSDQTVAFLYSMQERDAGKSRQQILQSKEMQSIRGISAEVRRKVVENVFTTHRDQHADGQEGPNGLLNYVACRGVRYDMHRGR